MSSRTPIALTSILVVLLLGGTLGLGYHAWRTMRISDTRERIQETLNPAELMAWLDLQLENARRKMKQLDPGPPPPWYHPRYYWDWLPRAKLHAEAQETFIALQKQKRVLIEHGKLRMADVEKTWNLGIAPILHIFLAFTLCMVALRLTLRIALVQGRFGWCRL